MTEACSCGCSTLLQITNAEQACGCGCACCAPEKLTREDEVEQLRQLRDSVERRLMELDAS